MWEDGILEKRYEIGDIKELRVLGRTNGRRNPLTLFWTASGFEVGFKGTELWCEFESDYSCYEQWIAVFVNGALLSRQMLPKGRTKVCLLRNMQEQKENRVCVLKEVQPMPADEQSVLSVQALYADGEFFELPEKNCKIEFIGDSITSGEGSYGSCGENDWIAQWFSTSRAYPFMVAKELSAEYRIFSQSGNGLCCAWDNNRESIIPLYYEQVCSVLSGERNISLGGKEQHDFSSWQPDFIVINLGTNDAAAFDQPAWTDPKTQKSYKMERGADGLPKPECMEEITRCATAFLHTVRKNNPKAEILWCLGLMGDLTAPAVREGIRRYQEETGDLKVSFIPLPEISGDQIGARCHPGVKGHEMAAGVIAEAIRERISGK